MTLKTLLAGAIALGFALPAFAQTDSFYIVQDVKTKRCTITQERPSTAEYTMVGPSGTIYKTRVEAENAMKTVKVCTHE
jgi:hypothetical protein